MTGRERVDLVVDPDAARAEIDLDRLDAMFAAGARTLLLTQPHNPWGRVFSRAELEGIRDVVVRHGARVVSRRDPCAAGAAGRRAHVVPRPRGHPRPRRRDRRRVEGVQHRRAAVRPAARPGRRRPRAAAAPLRWRATTRGRRSAWSAAVAAYRDGDPWLASLVERLDQLRTLLGEPAGRAPARRCGCGRSRRRTWPGSTCGPTATTTRRRSPSSAAGSSSAPATTSCRGSTGHARLNLATSPERLTEIVRRLAAAWT